MAKHSARTKMLEEKDYSNPAKFTEPKYANLTDMELVSSPWQ
jgi:hypothetical protein